MLRSFLRQSLVALAAVALFLPIAAYYGPPAQAWSVSINSNTCSSPSASVDGQGNVTITCGGAAGPPVCTVTGPSAGLNGTNITLTASCNPAATSYVWSGGNIGTCATVSCPDNGNTPNALTGPVNYTVTGSNGSGAGAQSPAKQVTWSTTPQAPSGCTISGAPGGSVAAGFMATLTVNCNGGGQPTSWSWTGTGAAGQTMQTTTAFAVNTTTTFTATATNGGGSSTTPGVTITIGGGGGGPISCTNVPGATRVIDFGSLGAGVGSQKQTTNFGVNDALIIRFTASPTLTTQTSAGNLIAAEYGDLAAPRYGALSASACDFTGGVSYTCTDRRGRVTNVNAAFAGTIDPQNSYSVVSPANCQPVLTPGVTYYWNITNINPATGVSSCINNPTGTCNMVITVQAPNGQ